ncbi:MAG: HIT family protein [Candidatus Bipolaricaulia bacterium]
MGDCPFYRIVDGEAPAHIIHEDGHTMAFLDINPVSRGHTLAIPKRHYRDLLDLPEGELERVIAAARRVAGAILTGLSADGVNLLHATGAAAGQTVFHFHLHLIPRYSGDGLHPWPRSGYRERSFPETARRIKEAL